MAFSIIGTNKEKVASKVSLSVLLLFCLQNCFAMTQFLEGLLMLIRDNFVDMPVIWIRIRLLL